MLNPDLDTSALARDFAAAGRLRVEHALVPDVAERLHACLQTEIPWRLACYDHRRAGKARSLKLSPEDLAGLGPQGLGELQAAVYEQARDRFQYVYQSFDLLDGFRRGIRPGLFAYRLMEYLAGDAFFAFIRALTGDHEVNRIDGHATCYTAGHFLKAHGDESPWEDRRFAYVIGVTRNWEADMGGQLQFLNEEDRVEASQVPGYNTLSLFAVPVRHAVSYVPPWVRARRLSVTGWLTVQPG